MVQLENDTRYARQMCENTMEIVNIFNNFTAGRNFYIIVNLRYGEFLSCPCEFSVFRTGTLTWTPQNHPILTFQQD